MIGGMAYDEDLAARIRSLVADEPGLTEKAMFGGLAFLIDGNMALAASGEGGILVRINPDESASLVSASDARVAEMRGRAMSGWLRVDSDYLQNAAALAVWVSRGLAYSRSLPAK